MNEILQEIDQTFVMWRGEKYHFFGGCDYHRLSKHPDIIRVFCESVMKYGLKTCGSETAVGLHSIYFQLEEKLAEYFGAQSAVLLPNTHLANIAFFQSVNKNDCTCFIDEKAHPSLFTGILSSEMRPIPFKHMNCSDLKKKIKTSLNANSYPVIVSEGVIAIDNTGPILAPLDEYLTIAEEFSGKVVIDDAHAVGVVGITGKGSWEQLQLSPNKIIQTASLSKAFGTYGGFVVGDNDLIAKIKKTPSYLGSSPLPLPICAAAVEALNILHKNYSIIPDFQKRVLELKTKLRNSGVCIPVNPIPVILIVPECEKNAEEFKQILLKNKIYPYVIKDYPGLPADGLFIFSLSSAHKREQFEILYDSVKAGFEL
ncbi:MAG: pyridoxal phosphate-dependent aminotransferase family protein [Desulfobacterales bacterium]|nr:pyridoxal phosphate-dependent aminotransferase family protein [Desulfobacterales bacterium]